MTVHVREAGVGSTLPAMSSARTNKVCSPNARLDSVKGEVHLVNELVLSSEHEKSAEGSVEENVKVALVSVVVPFGPEVIDVSDGAVSTVQIHVAGTSSTLPAASVARTSAT